MEDQIWNNIIKRLTDVETEESKLQLNQWLNASKQNQKLYKEAVQLWEWTALLPKAASQSEEKTFVHSEIEDKKRRSFKGVIRYGIAASLAVVTSLSLYYLSKSTSEITETVYTVHKAANGKMKKITLPDSSTIWLNAGSQVSYSKDFHAQRTRNIHLIGEAFFDVRHNEKQPFVVESYDLKTVVYGTSFNVSSYENSGRIAVTVKTGKVGVLLVNDSLARPTMLLSGNGIVYHRDNGKLEKINTHADEIATWINGDLIFEEAVPQEVFAALARKFDVVFQFNKSNFEGCKLTAKFPNQSLKEILTALGSSLHFEVNEHGKTIEIEGGRVCK